MSIVYILLFFLAALAGAVALSGVLEIIDRTLRWMSTAFQAITKQKVRGDAARVTVEVTKPAKSLAHAMQKPQEPIPEQFGTTAAEIASTPNYGSELGTERLFFWCWAASIIACVISVVSMLSPDNWPAYLLAGLLSIIISPIPGGLVYMLLLSALDRVSLRTWPQYERVARFRVALAEYRCDLAKYNALILRQQEQFWRSLDGASFERELGQLFTKLGYHVTATPLTADGGVDLVLERSGQRIVVQCKSHASKVGIATARELVASMIDFQAQKGILAVTSGVTKPVVEYVKRRNIEIYDLHHILSLQREHG
jgi:Holliday junction resolvase